MMESPVSKRAAGQWVDYAEAFAFLGNSLLAPMSQTKPLGIDPGFWAQFPAFDDEGVGVALEACASYAEKADALETAGENAVQHASVEYTRLFVGPPKPAAPPWETVQRSNGASVGFGEPTFAMQKLLREAGLEVSNENNQYADHIGIELLYVSVLCQRAAQTAQHGEAEEQAQLAARIAGFAKEHPLGWIDALMADVDAAAPEGYIAAILGLAKALLVSLAG